MHVEADRDGYFGQGVSNQGDERHKIGLGKFRDWLCWDGFINDAHLL